MEASVGATSVQAGIDRVLFCFLFSAFGFPCMCAWCARACVRVGYVCPSAKSMWRMHIQWGLCLPLPTNYPTYPTQRMYPTLLILSGIPKVPSDLPAYCNRRCLYRIKPRLLDRGTLAVKLLQCNTGNSDFIGVPRRSSILKDFTIFGQLYNGSSSTILTPPV